MWIRPSRSRSVDADAAAAAVAAGVAEQLLDDAEDGVLQGRRQPRASHVVIELDLRPPLQAVLADEVLDGLDDPRFVQDRRPQPADQPPRLVDGPGQTAGRRNRSLATPGRVAGERLAEGLEPVERTGKLLGEAVVNLVGHQPPLALLQFEHLPQQPLLLLEGLGGQALPGDVVEEAEHAGAVLNVMGIAVTLA